VVGGGGAIAGSTGGWLAGSTVLDGGGIDDPPLVDLMMQADNESPMIVTNNKRFCMLVFLRANPRPRPITARRARVTYS
jgi:hypothetical protein